MAHLNLTGYMDLEFLAYICVHTLTGVGVDEVNEAVDLVDGGDPAHAAEGLRELGGEAHNVILSK